MRDVLRGVLGQVLLVTPARLVAARVVRPAAGRGGGAALGSGVVGGGVTRVGTLFLLLCQSDGVVELWGC